MDREQAGDRWREERTTFQRVYDVLVGIDGFLDADEFAERADCSAGGARSALDQLVEMGIAERRDGRPAGYRRNDAYFRWKRIESLAREHSPAELRERLDGLAATDESFQEQYGVPTPEAVGTADVDVDDHDGVEERLADLRKWRSVRRDIELVRRAIDRAEAGVGDAVRP
jgi:predicted ArsR family transcriptional regulator